MGFAVVAEEVRNLAHRSAQAAKNTSDLIEESIARSNDGKHKLNHVAAAVRSITESADRARTLAEEVRAGSGQQAADIEQVAAAIVQMEQVTQTVSSHARESASAGQELGAQSDGLRQIVSRLECLVGAADRVRPAKLADRP